MTLVGGPRCAHGRDNRVQALHTAVAEAGALLGVPIGRLLGDIDVDVGDLVGAGEQRCPACEFGEHRGRDTSSCRTCPKVNVRRNSLSVEGEPLIAVAGFEVGVIGAAADMVAMLLAIADGHVRPRRLGYRLIRMGVAGSAPQKEEAAGRHFGMRMRH